MSTIAGAAPASSRAKATSRSRFVPGPAMHHRRRRTSPAAPRRTRSASSATSTVADADDVEHRTRRSPCRARGSGRASRARCRRRPAATSMTRRPADSENSAAVASAWGKASIAAPSREAMHISATATARPPSRDVVARLHEAARGSPRAAPDTAPGAAGSNCGAVPAAADGVRWAPLSRSRWLPAKCSPVSADQHEHVAGGTQLRRDAALGVGHVGDGGDRPASAARHGAFRRGRVGVVERVLARHERSAERRRRRRNTRRRRRRGRRAWRGRAGHPTRSCRAGRRARGRRRRRRRCGSPRRRRRRPSARDRAGRTTG